MTRRLFIALGALALASTFGCQKTTSMNTGSASAGEVGTVTHERRTAASPDDFGAEPIESDRATLLVYGMSCPLCATNVDQQLLALPGVSTVNVDLGNGWVTVTFEEGAARPSARALATAIVESGMTIIDVQAE